MVALDALVVTTALSTIRLDLGASIEALRVDGERLHPELRGAADDAARRSATASGAAACSWLALALFVAASAACALADSVGWLIAARAVQGAGAALVMPLAMALLSAAFPPQERGQGARDLQRRDRAGPHRRPGGGRRDRRGHRLAVDLLAQPPDRPDPHSARARVASRRASDRTPRLDIPGLALVTGAALGVVWGLMRGNSAGWGSPRSSRRWPSGSCWRSAFVAWEQRAREPMVPMRFFRSRAFSAGNAAGFFLFGSVYGTRVLPGAVPANRAGPWAARRRAATAAMDRHAVRGRTDRRRARQSGRRAAAGRPRVARCRRSAWPGSR